ncbi:aldehyde oxidoreductase molybdenum-binding subunit PaoC [Cronobacter dublinensis]|uniref:aldehyde oxidoreductase molybdenum-binding subunit PaoC n=1 Tax=Cronobacter dublinensis TaxID=413497 RepID=UPI0013759AFA|nr:aldehyde oxidoreductase molybdenum-binding subunit PaoC [Cronobacter dublinensis]EKY3088019.1 xanthine dehydrogenase family protein molybdopterin-binding subunit [Cronobacter dublinensis]ELQ6229178.1 xanthine dehydrogenase family protein molybdopterin-binding subunit [Cronobacter dublinensis]ELY4005378.1 xanthine dehydrogenase family protein molybdopterin-binding subunit [Cronobacter dublinensis]ELY4407950.1 xanthine dehydrogenase family protein molybdopterin-binding subunit [Cronobacter dub
MKFDKPATQNPIDQQNVVGRPRDRIDGPLKTSGQATYAYEWHDEAPNAAYGHVVGSAIAKGRITAMDTGAAEQAPGVLAVITAQNAGPLGKGDMNAATLLGGPEIEHYHQAIAVVVAETFEQARAAAGLITVTYEETPGAYDLAKEKPGVTTPPDDTPDKTVGDFGSAFNQAEVQFDATYTTPDQSHMAMEPHASMAAWEGDKLTLWTSSQMINWWRADLAKTLNIPLENIRVRSPYIGGGFGSKLFLRSDAVLAALGARAVQRPVKVMLPRPFIPNNTTHRPATIQRVRLGARRDGRLTAIAHESWSGNLPGGPTETATNQTELLYAGANRHTGLRLAELDLPEGNSMRAPGEAPGMMVLEIAIDEMAEKLGMDPVEFRIINDTQVDPAHPERFFSRRQLVECLRTGAAHFGWQQRNPVPGQVREGDWLVGLGMAAGFRNNLVTKSGARVHLDAQGQVTVETDMTDIGTGSYTIIAQTAAEMMGVPLESVTVRLGDSDYPISSGSGGQWGANSATAGVYAACVKLREAAAKRLGFDPNSAEFVDGQIHGEGRRVPLAQAAADGTLTAEDTMEYGALDKQFQQSTFAGHFVEVAVEANTGEVRVRRMLAVCAAGRILNPKTARSQVIGAMTMGLGGALMEELFVDTRRGFFVNHDMALYEVPVHADVPRQEVIFLEDTDPVSSPMKAKGVGELGLCGVSAAIANAIYNATGVRVREYPITLDKLLEGLPELAS